MGILLVMTALLFGHCYCGVSELVSSDNLLVFLKRPSNITTLPSTPNNSPVEVFAGFYVESLGNFKASEMCFDLDIYLRLSWKDERLAHQNENLKIVTDLGALYEMWLPDIFFANARMAHFQHVTVPNFSVYIYQDGTVALSRRVTMTVACNMDLRRYPLDQQICFVQMFSYAHTKFEMNVRWFTDQPLSYNPEIDLPELQLTSIKPHYCDGEFDYAKTESSVQKRRFSCLRAEIRLSRSATYHLVQSYIPTFLIVLISWISFWIDRNAVPARISLSFTTLLTLSTMGAGLRYVLPPVSYAKAIDYWYGVCMLFVFGALLEFAVVNNFMRRSHKCAKLVDKGRIGGNTRSFINDLAEFDADETPRNKFSIGTDRLKTDSAIGLRALMAQRSIVKTALIASEPLMKRNGNTLSVSQTIDQQRFERLLERLQRRSDKYANQALWVDKLSRVSFPLVFAMFSACYWDLPHYCDGEFDYAKTESSVQKRRFSCLRAEIRLSRSATYHLVQSYIPTFLIVLISWISFWIDRNAVPARISLSFTTLLTLSTMGAGLRYVLPPVSYAKAIDYWYGVCMLFVFGALLEFAVVNNFMRRSHKCAKLVDKGRIGGNTRSFINDLAEFDADETPRNKFSIGTDRLKTDSAIGLRALMAQRSIVKTALIASEPLMKRNGNTLSVSQTIDQQRFERLLERLQRRSDKYANQALWVDKLSRVSFPLVFAMFSACYWVVYLMS